MITENMLSTVRTAYGCWSLNVCRSSFLFTKRRALFLSGPSLPIDDKEEPTLSEDSLTFTKKCLPKKKVNTEKKAKKKQVNLKLSSQNNLVNKDFLLSDNKNSNIAQTFIKTHLNSLKKDKRILVSYMLSQESADLLVRHLKKDIKENDIIAESNPGPGILTRTLLKKTSNKIITFEPQSIFASELETSLLPDNASHLDISHLDLQKFYTYYVHGKKVPEKDKLQDLLKLLHGHEKDSGVKIVGVVCDPKFFFRLALSFVFQCCFYEKIFPVLYLYIPYKIYSRISLNLGKFAYSKIGVSFQFYFNLDILDSMPREGFYPLYTLAASSRKRQPEDDMFHLVRISANHEFMSKVPVEELENFHYFLNRICLTKRNETLIGQLEKWIPACGPDFIKNGFRVFSHPRELSQDQLLQAYYIFSKLPSYEGSMFHHYRRQWTMQFGEKDEDILRLKTEEEVVEMDDQSLDS